MQMSRYTYLSAACFLALALSGTAGAVEEQPVQPPPPPPTGAENPAQPIPEKGVSVSTLDMDWVIDDLGRRDPFTFTKNVVVMDAVRDGPIDLNPDQPQGLPP